jgi:hypothetical protein
MKSLLKNPILLHFLVFCLIIEFFIIVSQGVLIDKDLYYESLSDKLNHDRIAKLIEKQEEWAWLSYAFIPVMYAIKFSLVASCLWLAGFFAEENVSFGRAFGLAILAESVSLVPLLLKIGWFTFVQTDYTLADLQWFWPLSALNLFERENLEPYLAYPLRLLSVWELAYWLLLAYGMAKALQKPLTDGLRLVAASYGPGLVLWVLFVVFLTINLGR